MSEGDKLKLAFYWAASCGGCEIAVLDIDEKILDVVSVADIVFWPVAMDIKYKDVEDMEDGYIDVCFFNGSVRTEEQEHMARLLRKKSKVLVAFGACSAHGGIPGLANLINREEIFNTAYLGTPSTNNPDKVVPKTVVEVEEGTITLPEFYNTVRALDQVVDVDYYLPGCPPPTELIINAVEAIAKGELPPKGAVLAPLKSVCDECPREKREKNITDIKRVYEVTDIDPNLCLLEQGILCLGPATRGGCNARCLDANMPCTGCGGPAPSALDQGAKMISALASIYGLDNEKDMKEGESCGLVDKVVDAVGSFYKYTLPSSLINRKVMKE